ncbi:hypothetical protein [Pseudoalteromonas obscura]|uniref:PilZ domain-containing protein n=1 Tax=Pseudoalteromonas obscura TaxID=3048491 RepID=A0ABT7EPJ1_9GAMM|nr:hypothetical protein [Pseudoalteromonas sp. P94(2023)]MDK2596976.1 hypothetical protein [Pseudoalteromonas sp. P94(2023)]
MKLTQDELKLLHEVVESHKISEDELIDSNESLPASEVKRRLYQLWLVEPLALYLAHNQYAAIKALNIQSVLQGDLEDENAVKNQKVTTLLALINKLPEIIDTGKCPRNWRFFPSPTITLALTYPKIVCPIQSLSLSGACIASFPLSGSEHLQHFTNKHAYLELADNLHIHVFLERAIARDEHYIALQFNQHTRDNPMLKLLVISHFLQSQI